jgi:myo-inositol 2-dehydrogenase / D-chiro-inositol 1-dehydrogenase
VKNSAIARQLRWVIREPNPYETTIMRSSKHTRRGFLKSTAGALAAGWAGSRGLRPNRAVGGVVYVETPLQTDLGKIDFSRSDRFRIGAIGMRHQGSVITENALPMGDVVCMCDVDRQVAEMAKQRLGGKADICEDYREVLDRQDIDAVMIAVPDHWHTTIAIAACRAGKAVYCEKPLTLTIDEGKLLCRVVKETNTVFQVGTWQRSDFRFRLACEMVRQGRIGKLRRVTVTMGKNTTGGPFPTEPPPAHLNWDLWLGQAPKVEYCPQRCHNAFRFWYEYSGGQMTDWGAHHVDIAQWAMGMEHSGPVTIDGRGKLPSIPNGYNVPIDYEATLVYPDGTVMEVLDSGRRGILFEGDKGRIFVNRGTLAGKPVERLQDDPLPQTNYQLYGHDDLNRAGRTATDEFELAGNYPPIASHVANFFDCVKTKNTPISDVVSQHRSVSTCHLVNISIRVGRKLTWDPKKECFVGDTEANQYLKREQRKGFEVPA